MTSRILFVDDDPSLLAALQRNLRRQFEFDTALGGLEALELVKEKGPYALFVVDMSMPVMTGQEFLERCLDIAPQTVRIMLTGNADQKTVVEALNRGQVFRFLNKPCPLETLVPVLETGLKHYQMLQMERELLEGTLTGSVKLLSEVLGMVAPEALGRGQRLRDSVRPFALFVNAAPLWELEVAALLSSIGSAVLPAHLLEKIAAGEDRTLDEEKIVRRIPQVGHDLLVDIPRLQGVARIIKYQNQPYAGHTGDGDPCSREAIPLGSRMLKILGDRMTLEAEGVVKQRAFDTMNGRAGAYDPKLLGQCFACFNSFLVSPLSGNTPVRSLRIHELAAGQVVISDIVTPMGLVLVGAGNRLTPMVLERLHNYAALGEAKEPILIQDPAEGAHPAARSAA
jgi:response regulator RpfG family c-di-GMP phosphodiesterase